MVIGHLAFPQVHSKIMVHCKKISSSFRKFFVNFCGERTSSTPCPYPSPPLSPGWTSAQSRNHTATGSPSTAADTGAFCYVSDAFCCVSGAFVVFQQYNAGFYCFFKLSSNFADQLSLFFFTISDSYASPSRRCRRRSAFRKLMAILKSSS